MVWPLAGVAAENLVVNGSFEEPELPKTSPKLYRLGDDAIKGWEVFGEKRADVAVLNGPFSQGGLTFTHHDGEQSLDLTGLANRRGGVRQTLETVAGERYLLEFAFANVQSPGVWGNKSKVLVELNGKELMAVEKKDGPPDKLGWEEYRKEFVAEEAKTVL